MLDVNNSHLQDVPSEQSQENETGLSESRNASGDHHPRRKEIASRLRPIIYLMKLTGECSQDVLVLNEIPATGSRLFSRLYRGIATLGQWGVVVQCITTVFFEGFADLKRFYFLLIFSIWALQCAVVATICLYVFPNRQTESSRFSQFLSSLCSAESNERRSKKCKVNLILAFVTFFAIFNTLFVISLDLMYGSIISFRPWNGFLVYRLNFFAFIFCSCFSWALPFSLFYVSCDLLLGIFEDLETKVKAGDPDASDIRWIRQEHRKLCVRVDLANKVFSHLLLAAVGLDVPLMCFNSHQLVKSNASTSSDFTYLVSLLYWSVCVVVKLAFILLAGVRVNEKVRFFLLHRWFSTLFFLSLSSKLSRAPTLKQLCDRVFCLCQDFDICPVAISNVLSLFTKEPVKMLHLG